MCVMMVETKPKDGGQKDALLKRANIKKYNYMALDLLSNI